MLITTAPDDIFIFSRENKAWHFIWIICWVDNSADNSHEMQSYFLQKIILETSECHLQQFCFVEQLLMTGNQLLTIKWDRQLRIVTGQEIANHNYMWQGLLGEIKKSTE